MYPSPSQPVFAKTRTSSSTKKGSAHSRHWSKHWSRHQFYKVLIGTYPLRSCATLRTTRWEQSWDSDWTRSRRPSAMKVRSSSKLKLITRLRRKSFWKWSKLSRSSGLISWGARSSSTLIMRPWSTCSPRKRPNQDLYNGCCSFKNSTWRLKTRRDAKTPWRTTYRVSTSREERTSEIHFRMSISSPSRVTSPGTRTSSNLSSLDQSWSTRTGIKRISSSTSSSTISGKNRFCST